MSATDSTNDWRVSWADGNCPYCTGVFKGAQGVRVHISNAHPQQSQELKIALLERRQAARTAKSRSHVQKPTTSDPQRSIPSIEDNDTSHSQLSPLTDEDHNLPSVEPWETAFSDLLSRPPDCDISAELDEHVRKCAEFLCQAVQQLKGPKHPNTRFFEARRMGRLRRNPARYHTSSNPIRKEKRRKEQARERYRYELVQYQYHNTRRRAVRTVLNPTGSERCTLPTDEIEDHFKSTLGTPNKTAREDYPKISAQSHDWENEVITAEEVGAAIKGMAPDTSPGPDRVLLRVVKVLKCEKLLAHLATIMYQRSLVPATLRTAHTFLLAKDGDPGLLKNWRPITVFSVLRRIIERVLDRRLRNLSELSSLQKGFVRLPGTHVNTSIVNGVLRSARTGRRSCVVVFLDIRKAFDNIGHDHIRRTLDSLPLPERLNKLLCALCVDNVTQIVTGPNKTQPIRLERGVPQGAPLSPMIFNLCIDFILRELSEEPIANAYGYTLVEGLSPLTAVAFADDIVLFARDEESARRLTEITIKGLLSIGLEVNLEKSQAIVSRDGQLVSSQAGLYLQTGEAILTIQPGQRIRYLGVDYEAEIVFDQVKLIRDFKVKLDLIATSGLLHQDQKLVVINNFLWPALIYPLQAAPLHQLQTTFLENVDMLIRGTVKQICGLPMDTPNDMLYSPKEKRGLQLIRASWEAFLQHVNIARRLENIDDPYLHECRDVQAEQQRCLKKLGLLDSVSTRSMSPSTNPIPDQRTVSLPNLDDNSSPVTSQLPHSNTDQTPTRAVTVRTLRKQLRERAFSDWCALPFKGKGVELFAETPACNAWVYKRCGLSSSEWTNALKMSTNGCNLRGNPRTAASTTHCRHCGEFETLAHVLGKCPRGELLRNRRHQRVCDNIADDLRSQGYQVEREDHVTTPDQGSRFTDLLVLDDRSTPQKGFILDPTIRFERSLLQASEVDQEKRSIYEPAMSTYRQRFPNIQEWQVIGLLFGARGTLPHHTAETLVRTLGIPKRRLPDIALMVLRDSLGILHHHIYSRE